MRKYVIHSRAIVLATVLLAGGASFVPGNAGATVLSQISTTSGTLTETLDSCTESVPATATAFYSGTTFVGAIIRTLDGAVVIFNGLDGAYSTFGSALCGSAGTLGPPTVSATCGSLFSLGTDLIGGSIAYTGSGSCQRNMDVTVGVLANPTPVYGVTTASQLLCTGSVSVKFTSGTEVILPGHVIASSCASPDLCATWRTLPVVQSCQVNTLVGVTSVPWTNVVQGSVIACRWTQKVSVDVDVNGVNEVAQDVYVVTPGAC